jgi:hypothetical protein
MLNIKIINFNLMPLFPYDCDKSGEERIKTTRILFRNLDSKLEVIWSFGVILQIYAKKYLGKENLR